MYGSLLLFLGLTTLTAPSAHTSQADASPTTAHSRELAPTELAKLNSKASPLAVVAETGITATIKLEYKKNEYLPKTFYIYNEDTFLGGYVINYDENLRTIVLDDLTPGTYTVMCAFDEMKSHPGMGWTKCYVFLDDVKIEAGTEISVDASTAVNQFKGASYLPDGELAELDNDGYDEAGHNAFVPGNCLDKLIQVSIYDTKYDAWIVSAIGGTGTCNYDNIYGPGIHWRIEEIYDIMVNDISDRYLICQQRDNYTDEGIVATVAFSRGLSNLDLSNDPDNYRSIEEQFIHSPAFSSFPAPNEQYQFTGLGYEGWIYFPYTVLPWKFEGPYAMSYSTSANAADFPELHPYYRFELFDARVGWDEFYVKGQRFVFDDEGAAYVFSNFYAPSEISGTRAVDADGNEVYYEFPGSPALQVKATPELDYINGNSAPINAVSAVIYKNGDRFYTNINPVYKGLLGEDREADKIGLDASAAHDGEIANVDGENWNEYWHLNPNEDQSGVYSAIISNTNVSVDGTAGYNNTTLEFGYDRDDICPPALQALQFRTAEGAFAQTFAEATDVRVIVCAGDYDWTETSDYLDYNYESKPVSVKFEVSPSAANPKTWAEVAVSNREEYNNLAGYGLYFEGSFADVELAESGWFDVRITLTDQAGNTNTQEFGPVLRIDSAAGIRDAVIADSNVRYADGKIATLDGSETLVTVCAVDGRTVAAAYAATVDLSHLTPGLYIVTADGKSFKIVVK